MVLSLHSGVCSRPLRALSNRFQGFPEALYQRRRYFLMLRCGPPPSSPSLPGFECFPTTDKKALAFLPLTEQVMEARLGRGDVAYVGRLKGRPVSVSWARLAALLVWDIQVELRPAPDQAIVYGVYTDPCSQRRGISTALECALARELSAKGVGTAVRFIVSDNEAGLAAARRSGYRPAAVIRLTQTTGIRLHLVRLLATGGVALRFSTLWGKPLEFPLRALTWPPAATARPTEGLP